MDYSIPTVMLRPSNQCESNTDEGEHLPHHNLARPFILQEFDELRSEIEAVKAMQDRQKNEMSRQGDDLSALQADTATLHQKIKGQSSETAAMRRWIAKEELRELKKKVQLLMQVDGGFQATRRRFWDAYQAKKKGQENLQGSSKVPMAHARFQDGNALADATLFAKEERDDGDLFLELYGLTYEEVLDFHAENEDDGGLFDALDAHATRVANDMYISDEAKVLFMSFIDALRAQWPQDPKEVPNTPLREAYRTCWETFSHLPDTQPSS